jgi:hypothetical protein
MAAIGLVLAGWRGVPWLAALAGGIALVGWALRPDPDPDRWRRGAEGEVATAMLLARLPRRYVVLHDRRIPGSRANIDHLVVGPTGVWVIDTKVRRQNYPIDVGPVTFEADRVEVLLDVETVPLVAVHGSGLGRRGKVVDGVRIIPAARLRRRLRRGRRILGRDEIDALAARAERIFSPAEG